MNNLGNTVQDDIRNLREAAFYSMMWGSQGADAEAADKPESSAGPQQGEWGVGDVYGPAQGQLPSKEDIIGLRKLIPKFCKFLCCAAQLSPCRTKQCSCHVLCACALCDRRPAVEPWQA